MGDLSANQKAFLAKLRVKLANKPNISVKDRYKIASEVAAEHNIVFVPQIQYSASKGLDVGIGSAALGMTTTLNPLSPNSVFNPNLLAVNFDGKLSAFSGSVQFQLGSSGMGLEFSSVSNNIDANQIAKLLMPGSSGAISVTQKDGQFVIRADGLTNIDDPIVRQAIGGVAKLSKKLQVLPSVDVEYNFVFRDLEDYWTEVASTTFSAINTFNNSGNGNTGGVEINSIPIINKIRARFDAAAQKAVAGDPSAMLDFMNQYATNDVVLMYQQYKEKGGVGALMMPLPTVFGGTGGSGAGGGTIEIGERKDSSDGMAGYYIIQSTSPLAGSFAENEAYDIIKLYVVNDKGDHLVPPSTMKFEYRVTAENNIQPDYEKGIELYWNGAGSPFHSSGKITQEEFNRRITAYIDAYKTSCFVAGTKILVGKDEYKLIEDIEVGDRVLSFEERNPFGALQVDTVTNIFVSEVDGVLDVGLLSGTGSHPLLTEDGGFTPLGEVVESGKRLVDQHGELIVVDDARRVGGKVKVYNLQVEKNSTYVANGIRVHNRCVHMNGTDAFVSLNSDGSAFGLYFNGKDGLSISEFHPNRGTAKLVEVDRNKISTTVWEDIDEAHYGGGDVPPEMAAINQPLSRDAKTRQIITEAYFSDQRVLAQINSSGAIGSILGGALGAQLFGGSPLERIVGSTLLSVVGENLAELVANSFSFDLNLKLDTSATILSDLGDELASAGIGAVSSLLVSELINSLGIDGFPGEILNSAAGSVIGKILENISGIADATSPFAGIDLATIGTAVGALLGSKLASELINFDTIGGQLGSALGSSLGVLAVTAHFVGEGLLFGVKLGAMAGPVGAAIGAFVGFIAGGLIGSLFGGVPSSGADVVWNPYSGELTVANAYARKGGSKDGAVAIASSVSSTLNQILEASGAKIIDPDAVQFGNYGMRKSDFVYRPYSTRDADAITMRFSGKNAAERLINYGIYQVLADSDFKLAGGDTYIKRAIYNSLALTHGTNFDPSALLGDLATAERYENYLLNTETINAVISAEPDTAFTAEWAVTFARAAELGLMRRHQSDWYGGFGVLMDEGGVSAGDIVFGINEDPTTGMKNRVIGVGPYLLEDAIDVNGQTNIVGTGGSDLISLVGEKIVVGSTGANNGLSVNGNAFANIAFSNQDFVAQADTLISFASNELRKQVNVSILSDDSTEAVERFLGQLSDGTDLMLVGGPAEASIIDGAAARPTLTVGRSFALESDGHAVFRVSLSKPAIGSVTALLTTTKVNAASGLDFGTGIEVSADGVSGWNAASALAFATGQTELFVRVAVLADNGVDGQGNPTNVEGSERFTLTATVTAGADLIANAPGEDGVVSASGIGTILDASIGTRPLAWIDGVTLDEASGQAMFSIARSRPGAAGSLTFATLDRSETRIEVAAIVEAGEGSDEIHASDLGDNVFGGAGNDTLYGGRLDDWLIGGEGDDVVNAGSAGTGTLGGDGNYLDGGAGNDLLIGREGSDWLEGGDGVDVLEGGDGGDILAGGGGAGDVLHGGRGDDQYILRTGDLADEIRDESGLSLGQIVTQAYDGATGNVAAAISGELFRSGKGLGNWHGGGAQVGDGGVAAGGEDALVLGAGIGIEDIKIFKSIDGKDLIIELWPAGVFGGDRVVMRDWFDGFNKIETLRFADGNEIRLADFDTFVLGSDGGEVLVGTTGNDFVHAGGGNDIVYLLAGNDIGNGGLGNDYVSGDSGRDIVVGGDGDDIVTGGYDHDSVSGGRGDDQVYGDYGDDIVAGGTGDDEVIGGAGNDVFKYQRGDGKDTLFDALTDEWAAIWISGSGGVMSGGTGYAIEADGSLVHKTNGTIDAKLFDAATGTWSVRTRYDIDTGTLYAHRPANADAIVADAGGDLIEFGIGIDINDVQFQAAVNGRDLVIGIGPSDGAAASFGALADQIVLKGWIAAPGSIETFSFFNTGAVDVATTALKGGTDGDDTLTGGAGKNWITGGAGDDAITGDALDDILNGNSGQDSLSGQAGADVLLGGAGNDTLTGGEGADILVGGGGLDIAAYDSVVRASLANPGENTGDASGDVYDGIEGLRGSGGNDTLIGDTGENDLRGAGGDDRLEGGGGDDFYSFARGDGIDTILDVGSSGETVVVDADGNLQPPYVATVRLVDREGASYQFEHIVTNTETGEIIYRWQYDSPVASGLHDPLSENGFAFTPTGFVPAGWTAGYVAAAGGSPKVARPIAAPGGSDTLFLEDATPTGAGPTGDLTIHLSDLSFQLLGTTLEITLNTTTAATATIPGGKILIQNFRDGAAVDANSAIETLQFSDGTSVDLAGLKFDAAGTLLAASTDSAAAPVDDLIVSNASILSGGFGDDTLVGGAGVNTLQGGDGDDLLVGGVGADTLEGGAGIDTVSYAGSDGNNSTGVSVDLNTGLGGGTRNESGGDTYSSIENAIGSQLNDTITGNDADNILKGNRGKDMLVGGGGSADTTGYAIGKDVLIGGDGNDTLAGGVGDDNLDGGADNDLLTGGGDRDVLNGGDGNDILFGDNTTGTVVGGNLLKNGSFEDAGDAANDVVTGYGLTTVDLPGWTASATDPAQLLTALSGVTGINGSRALHLDNGAANTVSQTVTGLTAGETVRLNFSHALRAAGVTGGVEVLWNGVVVRTITGGSTALTAETSLSLIAAEDSNTLAFRALGAADGQGSVIDNVVLVRTTGGADQLIGGAGQDRLDGGAGNDTLLGGDGDDNASFTVYAGTSTASATAGLYGGAGNDTLDGGAGDDTLNGGAGNDSYLFRAGSGNDSVTIGGGQDDLIFDKIASNQLWLRQTGSDLEITAIGLGATVLVKNWFSGATNQARRIVAADKVLARGDVAALMSAMASFSATVPGGWPTAPSQAFTDALTAAWQDPASYLDRTVYTGTTGNDTIAADPLLAGGAHFYALGGSDVLTGSGSDDSFHFGVDGGFDTINGGAGNDTIIADVDNATIGLTATAATPLAGIEKITANGKANVVINLNANAVLDLTEIAVDGIAQINGSSGADSITGSDANDRIDGAGGDDVLKGGDGDDLLRGGAGNDDLDGGAGINTYDASDIATGGTIAINASGSTQHVAGAETNILANFTHVIAGAGDDTIIGSTAGNRLEGGAGNDAIDGGAGDDMLIGGVGADILKGGDGIDTASYAAMATASGSFTDPISGEILSLGVVVDLKANSSSDGTTAPVAAAALGDAAGDWFYQVENLTGSQFIDMLTGDDGANVLLGGGAGDLLYGGGGDDLLSGEAGSDELDGGLGTNTAAFAGNFADYAIVTGPTSTTVTGIGSRAADGTDTLTNIQFLKFADFTVSLGVSTNNAPVLGMPRMADQAVNDGVSYSYQIPATSFIDLDISGNGNVVDQMVLSATLADGSALPGWLSFDPATRTFSGTVPLADVGKTFEVTVTATDSTATISDNFLLTVTQAGGADIVGTAAADTLAGSFRAETMIGDAGNDVFTGSDGADVIDGGAGTDLVDYGSSTTAVAVDLATGAGLGGQADGDELIAIEKLRGSAHDDTLTGSIGQDDLRGGAGADRIDGGAEADLIEGGAGVDTLIGGAGVDTLYALTLADGTLEDVVDGGAGFDELRLAGDASLGIAGSAHGAVLDLGKAGNGVTSIENVVGTDLADHLTGNSSGNILKGGLGNDLLAGGGGNDTLEGGAGDDLLVGGAGADRLDGGTGNDEARYGVLDDGTANPAGITVDLTDRANNTGLAAGDILISIENVSGTAQADQLRGDGDANQLTGNGGDDILRGEGGADTLAGGDGDDLLIGGAGNDHLAGGAGIDTMVFSGSRASYTIDFVNRTVTHNGGGADGVDTYVSVERAQFADEIVDLGTPFAGSPGMTSQSFVDNANFSYTIPTTAFDDPDGDPGDPYKGLAFTAALVGGGGLPSWLVFNAATKTFSYAALAGAIGDIAYVRVTASDGGASVSADLSFLLTEGPGAPIVGTGGDDVLVGTFRIETIDGGAGNDRVSYAASTEGVTINLASGWASGGFARGDTLLNVEDITGSAYADMLTGTANVNLIDAGGGDDMINGAGGVDTLYGGAGDDSLSGGDGDDTLYGGAGADMIDGGVGLDTASYYYLDLATINGVGVTVDLVIAASNAGAAAGDTLLNVERITGTQAADTLRGNSNDNVFRGMEGNDTLEGGVGEDVLWGGAGDDTLIGGADFDALYGEAGNDSFILTVPGEDWIDGGDGTDTASFTNATAALIVNLTDESYLLTSVENIDGTAFGDTIVGSAAGNRLDGGAGDDTIEGKAGGDILIGGDGTDLLSYASSGIGAVFQTLAIGGSSVNNVAIVPAIVRTLNGVNVDIAANTASGADASWDVISGFENLIGSSFDDQLRGAASSTVVDGGAGNDVIYGGAGNDTLHGGAGEDFIFGEAGADKLYGDDGNDRLFGDGASDELYGGAGDDLLDAGDAGDLLDGGTGGDIMIGGGGADNYVIRRTAGADTIYNYDSDGARDSVTYDQADNIEYSELWFAKSGKDLQVKILGTSTVTTVKDWFVTAAPGNWDAADNFFVEVFVAGDRVVKQVDLKALLKVMSVTPEPVSFNDLSETARAQIQNAWGKNDQPVITMISSATSFSEGGSLKLRFHVDDTETADAGISIDVVTEGELQAFHTSHVTMIDENTRELTIWSNGQFGTGTLTIRANDGGLYSDPLIIPITIAAVGDGVTLGAATTSFALNAGATIGLPGLTATLIDSQEAIDYLYLDGLTVGTRVTSGANSFTATAGNTTANITGWNLSTLQLTAAAGSATDMTLRLRARSRDGAPGNYVLSPEALGANLTISVNGAPNAPTVLVEGTSSVAENGAAVRIATLARTDPDGTVPKLELQGADAGYFEIRNNNEIWTIANLNHETRSSLNLSVIASDNLLPSAAWTRTVSVTNVNEAPLAPTLVTTWATSVAENSGAVRVATLNRADPDGTTPRLVLQGADAGFFQVLNGNEIWTIANLDYETKASLTLNVAATDETLTGPAWTAPFTFSVRDDEDAPTAINVILRPFSETAVGLAFEGVLVADLSADDADVGATFTYVIMGPQAAKFRVEGAKIYLAEGQSLDADTPATNPAVVDIMVTDEDEKSFIRTGVAIYATPVNEAPTGLADIDTAGGSGAAGIVAVLADGATGAPNTGTPIGITLRATDPESAVLTYSLASNPNGWFAINAATGVISLASNQVVQYESTTDGKISLNVVVSDGIHSVQNNALVINVTDVNETPYFTSAASASISEAYAGEALVTTIITKDFDKDNSGFGEAGHRFELYGADADKFILKHEDGAPANEMKLYKKSGVVLDFENVATRTLALQIRVYDNAGNVGSLDAYQNFTVNVSDFDENPSTPNAFAASVAENSTGYLVTVGGSVDPEGQAITYEFAASGGNPGGLFSITQGGELSLNVQIDNEQRHAAFALGYADVSVVAKTLTGISAVRTGRITLVGVNEAPGGPSQPGVGSIAENATGYTGITFGGAQDPDGDPVSYVFANGTTTSGNFSIVNGNQLHVSAAFDREQVASASVDVYAFANGQRSTGGVTATVNIGPVDDNLPVGQGFTYLSTYSNIIPEDTLTLGALVAQPFASDADGDGLTWSIVGGNAGDALKFNDSNQLVINKGLDYETITGTSNYGTDPGYALFTITIRAAQANNPNRYVDQTLQLQISDLSQNISIYHSGTTWYNSSSPYGSILTSTTNVPKFTFFRQTAMGGPNPVFYLGYFVDINDNRQFDAEDYAVYRYSSSQSTYPLYYLAPGYSLVGNTLIQMLPPVVLDLDGSGIGATDVTVAFDVDGDGRKDQVAWIGAGQGFLALDRDGNGLIDRGVEISFVGDLPGARTDLEGLAAYDSNHDGVFDARDARFGEFRIWKDADSDGVSDAGELKTLAEAGIASISLAITHTAPDDEKGLQTLGTSRFTRTDGSTGIVGDVALGWENATASDDLPVQPLPGGGALAMDRDGNGAIDGATEVYTLGQALALFDSDGDARITSADARYADLRLWTDANRNDRAELVELSTLDQAGLISLGKGAGNGGEGPDLPAVTVARQRFSSKDGKYVLSTVNGEIVVHNPWIENVDERAGRVGPATILEFKNVTYGLAAPFILDLDGDGVETRSIKKSKARFDMNGDGVSDDTGWVGKGDGFLVIDRDGDGRITGAAELGFVTEGTNAATAFDGLAALDSNKDGKLSSSDTRFGELRVWVDANDNGVTDAGELRTLTEHGIASLSLSARAVNQHLKIGSDGLVATSTFTRTDGSTATLGSMVLSYRPSTVRSADATAPDSSIAAKLAALRQGLAGAEEMAAPGSVEADDPRLLLMAQSMAAFGARGGEADWKARAQSDAARFDYFAA